MGSVSDIRETIARLEELVAKCGQQSWESYTVTIPPSEEGRGRFGTLWPGSDVHLVRTTHINPQLKAKDELIRNWYSPYTTPEHYPSFATPEQASLVAETLNALPVLIAALKEALEDKERLDWLDADVGGRNQAVQELLIYGNRDYTHRAAIDAARKEGA